MRTAQQKQIAHALQELLIIFASNVILSRFVSNAHTHAQNHARTRCTCAYSVLQKDASLRRARRLLVSVKICGANNRLLTKVLYNWLRVIYDVYVHMILYLYVYVWVHRITNLSMSISMSIYKHMHFYVYVHVHICMHKCICTYLYL